MSFGVEIAGIKQVGNRATRAVKELFKRGLTKPGSFDKVLKVADKEFTSLGQEGLKKLSNIFKEEQATLTQKIKQVGQDIKAIPTKLRTAFISKYTPLSGFERDIYKASGSKIPKDKLPLQSRFELFAGAAGKAEKEIRIFESEVLDPIKNNLEDFNNLLALKRIESRLKTGLERTKVAGWTLEMVQSTMKELQNKVGKETFNKLNVQAVKYNDILDESLKGLVDSQRMSQEAYEAIKANNDFYAKFKVMKYVNDAEKEFMKGTGNNISLGKEDVIKAMTGIVDEDFKLGNLINTAEEVIYQNKIIGEKNRVMLDFAKVAEEGVENGFVKNITGKTLYESKLDPNVWDKVVYYENGAIKELAVNKEVANAIKGLTPTQANLFTKILSTAAAPFRWGVTTANAGFQVANLFADIPRNLIQFKYGNNAKQLIQFPLDVIYSYYTSFKGNFGKPNELFLQFLDSGSANSTIARDLRPEAFKSKILQDKNYNPLGIVLDSISKFSNAVEEGAKILGIRRGLPEVKSGKITIEQLADEVRKYSGSPDFLRRGTATRPLNLLYMFLNARIQGVTLDLKRLGGLTGTKEAAQSWAKLASVVGLPALTLAIINQEKYKEDLDKLKPEEKNNYFIIFRNDFDTNRQGEMFRRYWKIPKRETVKLFSNMVESGVQFAYDKNFENAKIVGSQILNEISPVNLSGSTLSERGESIISGLNPLLKVPYEYIANRNTFFHSDVVPKYLYGVESDTLDPVQQYYLNTPKFYQWLGEQTGESPIKLEHAFSSASGGFFTKTPVQSVIDKFKGKGRLDLTTSEKEELKLIIEDTYNQSTEKVNTNRMSQELYNKIGGLSLPEQKKQLSELKKSKWLTEGIYDRYVALYERTQLDYNEGDYVLKSLGVTNGRRAVSMYKLVKDLQEKERKEKLAEWKAKNLLTETIMDQLNYLASNPKKAEIIIKNMAQKPDTSIELESLLTTQ